jgi:4-amino-4-deoxy-L-arabinose transferase-like glycosyltransferase
MNKENFPFPILTPKKSKPTIFEIIIFVTIICIPFLSPILGFLFLKMINWEESEKPWWTFFWVSIFTHIIAILYAVFTN